VTKVFCTTLRAGLIGECSAVCWFMALDLITQRLSPSASRVCSASRRSDRSSQTVSHTDVHVQYSVRIQ
jgi:hypothetical protein